MTDPIRFESGRPMLFGGLRRNHAFAHADFGGQWRDFSALGPLPGQLGEHAYGGHLRRDRHAMRIYVCGGSHCAGGAAFDPDTGHDEVELWLAVLPGHGLSPR